MNPSIRGPLCKNQKFNQRAKGVQCNFQVKSYRSQKHEHPGITAQQTVERSVEQLGSERTDVLCAQDFLKCGNNSQDRLDVDQVSM